MFLNPNRIDKSSAAMDIVRMDHRTSDVFRKYGISYCCGGKWPLEMICKTQGLDVDKVIQDLEGAMRTVPVSNRLDFSIWDVDFTIDHIINIHHRYLKDTLPQIIVMVNEFAEEHVKKYPYISTLEAKLHRLNKQLFDVMEKEEKTLFPYIRHIAHANETRESYAALLIKTLRKPVEDSMYISHKGLEDLMISIRTLTDEYKAPQNACASHVVVLAKLRELDHDLMHHIYLEQSILFPKVQSIEKEFLGTAKPN